jgi:hypothetical protein
MTDDRDRREDYGAGLKAWHRPLSVTTHGFRDSVTVEMTGDAYAAIESALTAYAATPAVVAEAVMVALGKQRDEMNADAAIAEAEERGRAEGFKIRDETVRGMLAAARNEEREAIAADLDAQCARQNERAAELCQAGNYDAGTRRLCQAAELRDIASRIRARRTTGATTVTREAFAAEAAEKMRAEFSGKRRKETDAIRAIGGCGHIAGMPPNETACILPLGHDPPHGNEPGRG